MKDRHGALERRRRACRPLTPRQPHSWRSNGTLLAYGQTGSGKTYTIGEIGQLGTRHEGVAHRMIRALYGEIERDMAHSYEVSITFVQIWVERIYDLLAEQTMDHGHKVRPTACSRM